MNKKTLAFSTACFLAMEGAFSFGIAKTGNNFISREENAGRHVDSASLTSEKLTSNSYASKKVKEINADAHNYGISKSIDTEQGTVNNPYKIKDRLDYIEYGQKVYNGTLPADTCFILEDDITVNEQFLNIGGVYKGTFDGNGHTIYFHPNYENVHIALTKVSIFNELNGANIKNLNVDGVVGASSTSTSNAGAIAAIATNSVFSDVYVDVDIMNSITVGGLVGTDNGGLYERCTYNGVIDGSNIWYSGGIVGKGENTRISDCTFGGIVYSRHLAGGIIGEISGGYISRCLETSVGQVLAPVDAGGIVGYGHGDVEIFNCSAEGYAFYFGTLNQSTNIGGIAGKFTSNLDISYCNVTGHVKGWENVGGIAGYSESVIKDCSFTGSKIEGDLYLGGIVGRTTKDVENCIVGKASNPVTLSGDDSILYGGGIAGQTSANISRCNSYVTVDDEINNNAIGSMGGIVGVIDSENNVSIDNVYVDSCWNKSTENIGREDNQYVGLYCGHQVSGNVEYTNLLSSPIKNVYERNLVLEEQGYVPWTQTDSLPSLAGKYYLTKDLVLPINTSPTPRYVFNDGTTLNLNGHIVTCGSTATGTQTENCFYVFGTARIEGYGEVSSTSNAIYTYMGSYEEGMFSMYGDGELYLEDLYFNSYMDSKYMHNSIAVIRSNNNNGTYPRVVSFKNCTINFDKGRDDQWCYLVREEFPSGDASKVVDVYFDNLTLLNNYAELFSYNYYINPHFSNKLELADDYDSLCLFSLNGFIWSESKGSILYNRKLYVDESFYVKDDKQIVFELVTGDANRSYVENNYFNIYDQSSFVVCENFPAGKEKYFHAYGLDIEWNEYVKDNIDNDPGCAYVYKNNGLVSYKNSLCLGFLTARDGKLYYDLVGLDYDFSDGYKMSISNESNANFGSVEYGWQQLESTELTPEMCGNFVDRKTGEVKDFAYDTETKRFTFNYSKFDSYVAYYAPFGTVTYDNTHAAINNKSSEVDYILFKVYKDGVPYEFTGDYYVNFDLEQENGYYKINCKEYDFNSLFFYKYVENDDSVFTAEAILYTWKDLEGYNENELDTTGLEGTFHGYAKINYADETEMPLGQSHIKAYTESFTLEHVHSVKETHSAVSATCTADGHNAYYECGCGTYFSDESLTQEIGDENALQAWLVGDGKIVATGHTYGKTTYTWDGDKCTAVRTCQNCPDQITETKTGVYVKVSDATETSNEIGYYEVSFDNSKLGGSISENFEVPNTMLKSEPNNSINIFILVLVIIICGLFGGLVFYLIRRKQIQKSK